jgi:hypothetical protein
MKIFFILFLNLFLLINQYSLNAQEIEPCHGPYQVEVVTNKTLWPWHSTSDYVIAGCFYNQIISETKVSSLLSAVNNAKKNYLNKMFSFNVRKSFQQFPLGWYLINQEYPNSFPFGFNKISCEAFFSYQPQKLKVTKVNIIGLSAGKECTMPQAVFDKKIPQALLDLEKKYK